MCKVKLCFKSITLAVFVDIICPLFVDYPCWCIIDTLLYIQSILHQDILMGEEEHSF
jgi:hypothetical protein